MQKWVSRSRDELSGINKLRSPVYRARKKLTGRKGGPTSGLLLSRFRQNIHRNNEEKGSSGRDGIPLLLPCGRVLCDRLARLTVSCLGFLSCGACAPLLGIDLVFVPLLSGSDRFTAVLQSGFNSSWDPARSGGLPILRN